MARIAPIEATDEPGETVLRLVGITKTFGALRANAGIGFSLHAGEVVALLGENGAGKTTLMNILFGHYVADEGSIEVFGQPLPPGSPKAALGAGIGMVHQHFTLAENLTALDNILLGTESLWRWRSERAAARRRLRQLSADFGLDIDPDRRVADLTVGERQRVEILKALYRDVRILILDEPTAVLTPQEAESLFATLARLTARGLAIIFISHKLGEVLAVSRRILVLRQGELVAERDSRATDRHELAELMVGRDIPEPEIAPQTPGAPAIELAGIAAAAATGDPLRGIDLTLRGGEILGIAGVSGNGQSALADLLCGLQRPQAGSLRLHGEAVNDFSPARMMAAGIARIPEDRHATGVIGDFTVEENLLSAAYRARPFARGFLLDWRAARRFATRLIAEYDIRCPGPGGLTRLLSGGNMQKLILGREMSRSPRIVIANQPSRGLDIGAVADIRARLLAARREGIGILLISEDLDELLALSDRLQIMYRGRLSAPLTRAEFDRRAIGLGMAGQGAADGSARDAA